MTRLRSLMQRKKTPPTAALEAILPQELLEKSIPGPMDAAGVEALFQKLKKAVIERALGAELGVHLASPESRRGNHRNGRSGKTVLTDESPLRIEVPRDRTGSPLTLPVRLVPQHRTPVRRLDPLVDQAGEVQQGEHPQHGMSDAPLSFRSFRCTPRGLQVFHHIRTAIEPEGLKRVARDRIEDRP